MLIPLEKSMYPSPLPSAMGEIIEQGEFSIHGMPTSLREGKKLLIQNLRNTF